MCGTAVTVVLQLLGKDCCDELQEVMKSRRSSMFVGEELLLCGAGAGASAEKLETSPLEFEKDDEKK